MNNSVESEKPGKENKKEQSNENDAYKPSRPIGSYFWFNMETIPQIKKDEGLAHKDAMKKAGAMWSSLTDEEKQPYNDQAAEDKKR